MIAVDTNILVYAHRRDSPWHAKAAAAVRQLAEGPDAWAIPWACLHEFFAIVTHPRIYRPPTPLDFAITQGAAWLEAPGLQLLTEGDEHWQTLREIVLAGQVCGPKVHDARIAAICAQHGIDELWTADRDFSSLAGIVTKNPLLMPARSG